MIDSQPVESTFRVGAHHQLFHAELRAWRLGRGLTQKQLSAMAGMQSQRIGWLETFKTFPTTAELAKLEDITGIAGERLFPAWLKEWATGPKTATTEHDLTPLMLSDGQFRALPAPDDVEGTAICDVDQAILAGTVDAVLGTLTERERRVITARFGLDDGEQHTLAETAELTGYETRERVRQIEAKAIRKLRHPVRSNKLAPLFQRASYEPTPAPKPSQFRAWLLKHRDDDNELGALARIIESSKCCDNWAINGLRRHIETKHQPPTEFWLAFDQAVARFKIWLRTGDG